METLDNTTLVTATGGNHCGPRGCSPPFAPYPYPAAPRWAYAGGFAPYAYGFGGYAPPPPRWAPAPAPWWASYRR